MHKNRTKKPILVMNVGSSSIKFKVFYKDKVIMHGYAERLNTKRDYDKAIGSLINVLKKRAINIAAVGHRIVHGAEMIHPLVITPKVLAHLKKIAKFAPLHNIPEIRAIQACKKLKAKQVAVFDTAFHRNMPEKAKVYALPYKLYREGIMRYGFHGISCSYILKEVKNIIGKTPKRMLICHLGNGSSITALKSGRSIDTSMGLTPLEGVVMATRSGSIDPGIEEYLTRVKHYSPKRIFDMLNRNSGLLGISGKSHDLRDLLKARKTSKRAKLAVEIFIYSIVKQIGAYAAALNGLDAIVFTAGIGQNSSYIRNAIMKNFTFMRKFKVLTIKTDEELMIKREVEKLL